MPAIRMHQHPRRRAAHPSVMALARSRQGGLAAVPGSLHPARQTGERSGPSQCPWREKLHLRGTKGRLASFKRRGENKIFRVRVASRRAQQHGSLHFTPADAVLPTTLPNRIKASSRKTLLNQPKMKLSLFPETPTLKPTFQTSPARRAPAESHHEKVRLLPGREQGLATGRERWRQGGQPNLIAF